ncbi:polymeric immunoglobulin receptor-like [Misgurnus anguillicaudatus]|uniref:polymeric immunoglobulin receptor-like n=1 Tax=Misgurnus anguillicaudatus TaxID=75329 RepID=UPI003CCFB1F2
MIYIKDLNTEDSGTYWIGVDGQWSIDMNLTVREDSCCWASQTVMVNTGETANFRCQYSQDYKTDAKIIFKQGKDSIMKIYSTWEKKERFSISDDGDKNLFNVRISDVRSEDAGVYLCGVWLYRDSYSYSIITAVHLNIMNTALTHWWVNKSVFLGDEVDITCQIPEEHQVSKLFCKEDENHICQNINSSKVKLNDLSPKSVFTVTISNVTVRDAGVYWCGAETTETDLTFISLTTKVQLNLIMPPVFGDEGGSALIICPYDPIYKSKSKYLCKSSTTDRNPLIETVRDEMKMNRLTVNDDMTASVFTVNITGLTAEDAGKYCCTVRLETDVIYLYTHLIIIMNEKMILNKREGDDMSIQCKHHAEYQKLFCKAHKPSMCINDGVSLQSMRDNETSAGVFTVNISHLREEDSGKYWCGSHIITKVKLNVTRDLFNIIMISVCVLLLSKTIMLLVNLGCIKR